MTKKLLALVLLAGSSAFAETRFSFGVGFGAPVVAVRPPCPGPGYSWVDGYYDPYGTWINGYWAPPAASFRFAPRYDDRFVFRRDFGRPRGFDRDFHRDHDRGHEAGFGFRR